MKTLTQKQRILSDLEMFDDWTPATYWWNEYPRITKPSTRVSELRQEGHNIEKRMSKVCAEYKLIKE